MQRISYRTLYLLESEQGGVFSNTEVEAAMAADLCSILSQWLRRE